MGFVPQSGDQILFSATASMLLHPRANGIATWMTEMPGEKLMLKLPEQFKAILDTGKPLDESAGEQMARWAKGGGATTPPAGSTGTTTSVPRPADAPEAWEGWTIDERAENRASKGTAALQAWWATVPAGKEKTALATKLTEWKATAAQIDAKASS